MSKSVSRAARKRADSSEPGMLMQTWRDLGIRPAGAVHFLRLASAAASDLPPIVARLDDAEIASRIAVWRAANKPLDALFLQRTPPADALRRFGLTHWAAGNPRAASVVLATAAAVAPDDAALWLDLGSTLHAAGEAAAARPVFDRALALDFEPGARMAWPGAGRQPAFRQGLRRSGLPGRVGTRSEARRSRLRPRPSVLRAATL